MASHEVLLEKLVRKEYFDDEFVKFEERMRDFTAKMFGDLQVNVSNTSTHL